MEGRRSFCCFLFHLILSLPVSEIGKAAYHGDCFLGVSNSLHISILVSLGSSAALFVFSFPVQYVWRVPKLIFWGSGTHFLSFFLRVSDLSVVV